MPKISKTFDRIAYNRQYNENNYFRINLTLPKDFETDFLKAVEKSGLSKNAFIRSAILEKIERG